MFNIRLKIEEITAFDTTNNGFGNPEGRTDEIFFVMVGGTTGREDYRKKFHQMVN